MQILTEEVECTEEEAITFAALQFQVKAASQSPQNAQGAEEVDDIDAALNDLQVFLLPFCQNASVDLLLSSRGTTILCMFAI